MGCWSAWAVSHLFWLVGSVVRERNLTRSGNVFFIFFFCGSTSILIIEALELLPFQQLWSALPVFRFSALIVWTCSCRSGTRTSLSSFVARALSFLLSHWPAEHVLIERKGAIVFDHEIWLRPTNVLLHLSYVDQLDQQLLPNPAAARHSLHGRQDTSIASFSQIIAFSQIYVPLLMTLSHSCRC